MKSLFVKYRTVFTFLGLFIGTYLLLAFLYSQYLYFFQTNIHQPDFITRLVAKQSSLLLSGFGINGNVIPDGEIPAMTLLVEGSPVATIVEGCNAVSIIILFIAFVVSFAQGFKKTALFIFAGTALIYSVNIGRIALLAYLLYMYPQHTEFLHGVVFPAIIYGMVFLLWVGWVRMLPKPEKT